MAEHEFTHLDGDGRLRMVDVSSKEPTRRVAEASCLVVSRVEHHAFEADGGGPDLVLSARLAGIHAAKVTADLIPLCHPLSLSNVELHVATHQRGFEVSSQVIATGPTGVEMEALTACCYAALRLVTTLVATDPEAHLADLVLRHKSGGRSGDWGRDVTTAPPGSDESPDSP